MADLTRDDIFRLWALLGNASPVPWSDQGHVLAPGDSELLFAAVNALPALLDAAERGLDDGLVFGPWFEGERHAVAADGGRYTIAAAPEGFYFTAPPHNEPCPCESGTRATESEAIEAARAHDRARRAKGTT